MLIIYLQITVCKYVKNNYMGRFWIMLATADLGGAKTVINQVFMGIQSSNKYFNKITD